MAKRDRTRAGHLAHDAPQQRALQGGRRAAQDRDVYLAHPLMVHCGSMDMRSTLRWLSNPNFALRTPLDPLRRDASRRSPVEEAIVRALGQQAGR